MGKKKQTVREARLRLLNQVKTRVEFRRRPDWDRIRTVVRAIRSARSTNLSEEKREKHLAFIASQPERIVRLARTSINLDADINRIKNRILRMRGAKA